MKRLNQKIYALQLTHEEANALLVLLDEHARFQLTSRALARVYRRLIKAVELIGDEQ